MTGFGEGRRENERLAVSAEIRSVNNKHLKVSVRCADAYLTLENDVERLVRNRLARGTVYVNLRVDRLNRAQSLNIDGTLLAHYWEQLTETSKKVGVALPLDLSSLMLLPGVVAEQDRHQIESDDFPLIEAAVDEAITTLQGFRETEGASMQRQLGEWCEHVAEAVDKITERAPTIVSEYRKKLIERVNDFIKEGKAQVTETDIIREVSIHAYRCDITEEITRLRCHLEQFRAQFDTEQSPGRKLDFLCQEMFREINTIGSKANNVDIAHIVVDVKTTIEKVRELVQNVE